MLIKVDDNNVFNRTINSVRPCPTNLKPNSADGGNKTTRRRRCFVLRWHFLAINFLRLRKIPFYNFKMRSIFLTDFSSLHPSITSSHTLWTLVTPHVCWSIGRYVIIAKKGGKLHVLLEFFFHSSGPSPSLICPCHTCSGACICKFFYTLFSFSTFIVVVSFYNLKGLTDKKNKFAKLC